MHAPWSLLLLVLLLLCWQNLHGLLLLLWHSLCVHAHSLLPTLQRSSAGTHRLNLPRLALQGSTAIHSGWLLCMWLHL